MGPKHSTTKSGTLKSAFLYDFDTAFAFFGGGPETQVPPFLLMRQASIPGFLSYLIGFFLHIHGCSKLNGKKHVQFGRSFFRFQWQFQIHPEKSCRFGFFPFDCGDEFQREIIS